jgi:5,10-methylenetetrahydromethanopterin reductase
MRPQPAARSTERTRRAEPAPPAYVGWARKRIDEGRAAAGRGNPHRMTVFIKGRIDPDRRHAREWVARILLEDSVAAQLAPLDRDTELADLRALGDPAIIATQLPDDLLDQLTATGIPEQVLSALHAIAACGVDAVAIAPIGPNHDEQLDLLAQTVVPAFHSREDPSPWTTPTSSRS